jgi:sporulation-control protein
LSGQVHLEGGSSDLEIEQITLELVARVEAEHEVKGAKDKGDLDQLTAGPLPAQEAVLEAFGQLGFGFTSADLELGHINGTGQTLPFCQEIEQDG